MSDKRPATQTKAFIAAVGTFVGAAVGLLGYLTEWPPEVYPLVLPLIAAALAVWRSGVGLSSDQRGYSRIEVIGSLALGAISLIVFVALLSTVTGCATFDHAKAGAGAVAMGACVSTCAATCAPELSSSGLTPESSAARYGLCLAACSSRCLPAAACLWTDTCGGETQTR
jgi:hypothetical protein